jgi:putative phosphoribosyl transferase
VYFASRTKAGKTLASQLVKKYRRINCVVLALDDGGAVIGAQIANKLHCIMMLLLSSEIKLPQEPDAVAGMTSGGDFAYNSHYTTSEINEFNIEFRGYIEQEKLLSLHELNRLIGKGSVINKQLLKDKVVIIVSDGLKESFSLDLALAYLKIVKITKLIVATPLASVPVVDRMHVASDEIYCLSVVENYMDTAHYYEKSDIPKHEEITKLVRNTLIKWI